MYGNQQTRSEYGTDRATDSIGSIAGGLAGAKAEGARQLEIPAQIDRLERELKGCLQGLEHLESKLSASVLRSDPPSPVGTGIPSPTAVMQTQVGNRLQELTNVASMLDASIRSILGRLEA